MGATVVNNTSSLASSALPRWVNTIAVILIGYALAVVSLKMYATPDNTYIVRATNVPANNSTPAVDLLNIGQQIASRHLFGDATKPVEEIRTPVTKPVGITKLNLTLAGVFAYEPQERAIAIIGTANNEESAYRVGDKIVGDVTLKAVYPDRVIIDNAGKDEVLQLPNKSTPIASRRPVTNQPASNNGQANAGGPVELPSTPGALRDTLAKNPSMLGRIVAAEPYQENGKLVGYRLTPKQNPEILEAQGIVAGDIITRVNNIELNSQKQGIRALRNAVKAQSLDVTILRDGVEIPLSISLAE